jgi:hypothetical protein
MADEPAPVMTLRDEWRDRMSTPETSSSRTQRLVHVRAVTHIQASRTERDRGEDGDVTLQLILDSGVEESRLALD